jgi:hypothetical protein
MHARAAYIRSIGTTGILVAAALLMLATVSALVAYHGWPGSAGGESVTAVPVQTPREFRVVRSVTKAEAATKVAGRIDAVRPTTAGLVRDVTAGGPSTVGLVKLPPPAAAPAPAPPTPVPAPTAAPAVDPPVSRPSPPSPPSIAIPEVLPAPVDGVEEIAFGVLGTALPPRDETLEAHGEALDLSALALGRR